MDKIHEHIIKANGRNKYKTKPLCFCVRKDQQRGSADGARSPLTIALSITRNFKMWWGWSFRVWH